MKNEIEQMKQHTPGPWEYSKGTSPHHQTVIYAEESGRNIAVTYNDEGWRNAALIAAAPEMMEALREIAGLLSGATCSTSEGIALDCALAAIDKAEGRDG